MTLDGDDKFILNAKALCDKLEDRHKKVCAKHEISPSRKCFAPADISAKSPSGEKCVEAWWRNTDGSLPTPCEAWTGYPSLKRQQCFAIDGSVLALVRIRNRSLPLRSGSESAVARSPVARTPLKLFTFQISTSILNMLRGREPCAITLCCVAGKRCRLVCSIKVVKLDNIRLICVYVY